MVEAAFHVPEFRDFACGESASREGRTLVDVQMRPLFAADEDCPSRTFAIYREGEPTNTDAVVRLSIGQIDGVWKFSAWFFDPPSSPDDQPQPGGGFDDVNYYCGFDGGRLERTANGWVGEVVAQRGEIARPIAPPM